MTKARDFADIAGAVSGGKIASDDVNVSFENISDTGTEGTKVATGTTAQRGSTTGQWRYNTTTGFFEGRNQTGNFSTLEPTPTIASVDVTEVDSQAGGNQTIVVTGTNFSSGGTITFVGNAGADFNHTTNPYEVGLGRFVDEDKADFVGKAALASAPRGLRHFGIKCGSGTPLISGDAVKGGTKIGKITAGALSPFLQFGIGYVLLDKAGPASGDLVEIRCNDGKMHEAELVELPFYDKAAEIPRGKLVDIPSR